MARICLVAMNSINDDLVFTVEVASDFPDKRLPTLDFFLWPEEWGRQMLESVIIQKKIHHNILNSRSEYNRCSLPRLSTRLGEKKYKK